jgi:prolyl-tRNA synthetase
MGIELHRTVKSVAVWGDEGFVLVLVRGDHVVNEIKLRKLPGLQDYRLATEAEILDHLGPSRASSARSGRARPSASSPTAASRPCTTSSSAPTKPASTSPA